jgi:hypothetical protein
MKTHRHIRLSGIACAAIAVAILGATNAPAAEQLAGGEAVATLAAPPPTSDARAAMPAAFTAYQTPAAPRSGPPLAFGFLIFDWDPEAPGGVPGFDAWPHASRPAQ